MPKTILLLVLLPVLSFSQLSEEEEFYIDSLQDVISTAEHDSIIIKAWKAWDNVIYNVDPDLDYELNLKIDSLSDVNLEKDLDDRERYFFLKSKGNALNILGIIHRLRSEFDIGIEFHESSLQVLTLINDKKGMSNAISNIGNIYNDKGDYFHAIEYQMRSLKIDEARGDQKGIAASLNNIGIVYEKLEDFERAIIYYAKSLKIKEEEEDKIGMANSMNNLGIAYHRLGNVDSALYFQLLGLEIEEEVGSQAGISRSLTNLGDIYMDLGAYDTALNYFNQALSLQQELQDDYSTASTLQHLGNLYKMQNDVSKALGYYERSLAITVEIGAMLWTNQTAEELYNIYKQRGNTKKALEMYELHIMARDSVYSETNQKEVVRQEYKRQYEIQAAADSTKAVEQVKIKDTELQLEKAESARHKLQTYYLYAGLGGVILFGIFISNRFRVTNRQKRIIEAQQKKVVEAYHQLEEKNTEILDSITYAKRIQNAILPPIKTVKEHFNDSFILYKPKDIVAGDFYWFEYQNGYKMIAVADCTGHGVPGAMVSVVCNNGLNRSVRENNLVKPGEILDHSREIVLKEFEKSEEQVQDGMDIALCCIKEGENGIVHIQYAGAHNPLWFVRNGSTELEEIKADKQHIGQFRYYNPFNTHQLKLKKGDMIYLFSDGYADQFGGEKGRKFKTSQFKTLISEIAKKPIEEQKKLLNKAFEDWKGALEQIDDVCVLGIRL